MTEQRDKEYWNPQLCAGYARCGSTQQRAGFGTDTGFDYRPVLQGSSCQCARDAAHAYSTSAPMAKYEPGQRVCLAYPSKNHVAACGNPYIPDHGVRIYRSERNATSDPTFGQWPVKYSHLNGQHQNGMVDYKGFQNCPKFCENMDKSLCTLCFDLESDLAPGMYTFHFDWTFNGPTDAYASCFEAEVVDSAPLLKTASTNMIDFKTEKGQIWANGQPFMIKGASWFGFEEVTNVIHGLWGQLSIDDGLAFLAKNDFNALRVPYSVSTVLTNPLLDDGLVSMEPTLQGKRMLDALDLLIAKAQEHNIVIMLDAHRLRPEAGIGELWYDDLTSESDCIQAWTILARRFCSTWNVIAADLKNEPHGEAEWGSGSPKDWRLGAERLGNAVLQECPRWLIFVEGVEKNIVGDDNTNSENGWWGGKLQGARNFPIRLSDPSKLVYSPHVYGPSVFMKPSFAHPAFPENLVPIWTADFGQVPEFPDAKPIVVGEWGGHFVKKDKAWQERIQTYMVANGIGHFYWSLNPNSGDTGGLLQDDWQTPEQSKLDLLKPCASTKISALFKTSE